MFLGPSGTDQAIPVAANDVSVADPPAQDTNAADKADKQSIQKHRLFFFFLRNVNMVIHLLAIFAVRVSLYFCVLFHRDSLEKLKNSKLFQVIYYVL